MLELKLQYFGHLMQTADSLEKALTYNGRVLLKKKNSLKQQQKQFSGSIHSFLEVAPILWPPDAKSQLIRKDPDAGKGRRQEEKGTTEDVTVGWHH